MGFFQKIFADTDLPDATPDGHPDKQQSIKQTRPVDGNMQQQIVDASFQRLVIMFITRLVMYHRDKLGEQQVSEKFFIKFPTVIDGKNFKNSLQERFVKELPGSTIKLIQLDQNSWDVSVTATINIPALVEKHMPQFRSKLDAEEFNILNGLNPVPQYKNNPNFHLVQQWIELVEQTIVDNLKPIGKPFAYLANRELQVNCNGEFPPQAVIPVENHFSTNGLICKIIDNRDVMEGQMVTLLFTPEAIEPDYNIPQLNGSCSEDHIIETRFVDVANH